MGIAATTTSSTRASDGGSDLRARSKASSDRSSPFDFDDDAVAVVSDESAEPEPLRQCVDERPEADALHDAGDSNVSPGEIHVDTVDPGVNSL